MRKYYAMNSTQKKRISIAFYNLENFFDTYDDPHTNDDAFTPKGLMHWIKKRFNNKSKKIARSLRQIGYKETQEPPVLIGLAEVENKRVIKAILNRRSLKNYDYDYIHFESADKRGMDVALLYRKSYINIIESKVYPVILYNDQGEAYPTRDILYVQLNFFGETMHVYVNHWPSRREGDMESDIKRHQAVNELEKIIDYVYYENPEAKFIVMGDFNTDPDDPYLKSLSKRLFNPALKIYNQNKGTLSHHYQWHLFDQIMLSHNFKSDHNLHYIDFKIFNPSFLKKHRGKDKGKPFRSYKGRHYLGGYSDHFPVYVLLEKVN